MAARSQDARRLSQPASDRGSVDLRSLFVTFASSALINLGEAADRGTGERLVDLDQEKDAIDLLLLRLDKTAGNRTEQHESRLLEQIISTSGNSRSWPGRIASGPRRASPTLITGW